MKIKISIGIFLLILIYFCIPSREQSILPQFAIIQKGNISKTITSPGFVESLNEIQISSQVMGKIEKLYVKKGQKIEKGQELVQLFADDYKSELKSVEAKTEQIKLNILMSEKDLEKSKRDFERSQKLHANNASTQMETDDLKTLYLKDLNRLEITKKQLLESEAIFKKTKTNFENTLIKSNIAGIVVECFFKEGETVIANGMNQNPIMIISNVNELVVKAKIDETDISLLKVKQKAKISLQYDENLQLDGEVIECSDKGWKRQNEEVSYFEAIVKINEKNAYIKLGMSAHVEILIEEKNNVLLIPLQAVQNQREGKKYSHYIFDKEFKRRNIEVGISDENQVEIKGLKEREKVLVGPHRLLSELKNSQKVVK